MFTGIIEQIGTITHLTPTEGDLQVQVKCPQMTWQDVQLGDSIATNGVCLTVIELMGEGFRADVSRETIEVTTVSQWRLEQAVNLEKALTPDSRLGGHMVSGHVDGIGEIVERKTDARSERFTVQAPTKLARYIAGKGSITVDGTSLTVNAVKGDYFELNIVPHTLDKTVMGDYHNGTKVNLEVDIIARYLERLLQCSDADDNSKLTKTFLAEHGFLNH